MIFVNNDLKSALKNVLNGESAAYLNCGEPQFSEHFEQEMERLVNGTKTPAFTIHKRRGIKVKALLIAAAMMAALGISLTAGAAVTRGFTKTGGFDKDFRQPTVSFSAANTEGGPETIEQFYEPSVLPQGINYQRTQKLNADKTSFSIEYMQELEDMYNDAFLFLKSIHFTQMTKAEFSATFEAPKYVDIRETTVNGCPAYLVVKEKYYGNVNYIFWDNGDYVFLLRCNFPVDETMRIAESVVASENAFDGEVME